MCVLDPINIDIATQQRQWVCIPIKTASVYGPLTEVTAPDHDILGVEPHSPLREHAGWFLLSVNTSCKVPRCISYRSTTGKTVVLLSHYQNEYMWSLPKRV